MMLLSNTELTLQHVDDFNQVLIQVKDKNIKLKQFSMSHESNQLDLTFYSHGDANVIYRFFKDELKYQV
jgi:hypothetical protein